jgi:hypothetical protein
MAFKMEIVPDKGEPKVITRTIKKRNQYFRKEIV